MRHRKAGRQLRRTSEQKLALMRNLASSLIEHGAIETTEAKAKELRPFVEKLITKARSGTLHARRLAGRHVQKRETADKLFRIGVDLNFFLIVFNLLPVPPLDGSHVLYHLLPTSLAQAYRQIYPYGFVILYALLFTGALGAVLDLFMPVVRVFLAPGDLLLA